MKRKLKLIVPVLAIILVLTSVLSLSVSAAGAVGAENEDPLPSTYQNNCDNLSYITSVKNQDPYGLCWAFAAVACAEADAIKNHGANKNSIDLSEWHLSYFAFNESRVNTGDRVYLTGNEKYYDIGGYDLLAALTLSNWIGFVDEELADYDDLVDDPSLKLGEDTMYEASYKIKNVYFYDIQNEPDTVKRAIMEYGAVAVSYYSDTYYLASRTYAQYCADSRYSADHAVTIVGWDDDYSTKNFSSYRRPSSNGAWLCKNSWGDDWGLHGYFWISYEDATLVDGTVYDVVPAEEYDRVYSHDGGVCFRYIEGDASCAAANVFRAMEDQTLAAVSIGTFATEPTPYTLEIYVNTPDKVGSSSAFDFSDGPVLTQSGYIVGGINTVELEGGGLELMTGEYFAVSFTTAADLMVDASVKIDMGLNTYLVSEANTEKNQTYYRDEKGKWEDVSDTSDWNFRIKAYTVDSDKSSLRIEDTPSVSGLFYGHPLGSADLYGGYVVDTKTGREVTGKWTFYDPDKIPEPNEKVTVKFYPDDRDAYYSVFAKITVVPLPTVPDISMNVSYNLPRVGDEVDVRVTFTDYYGNTDVYFGEFRVYYSIDGLKDEYEIYNGSFIIPEEAAGRTLTVYMEFYGEDGKYEPTTLEISIDVEKESANILYPYPSPPIDNTTDLGSDMSVIVWLIFAVSIIVLSAIFTLIVITFVLICICAAVAAAIIITLKVMKKNNNNDEQRE